MKTLEAIRTRRSINKFDAKHTMSQDKINEILSLAMLSPTAYNLQNWRFVTVTDNALRNQIRAASMDQSQVTDCSLFIIMCADLNAWRKQPERYWNNAPEEVQGMMVDAIDDYYRNKETVQNNEAMRSCGIAAQTLMLAARSMGYDSNPMGGFDFDKVAKLIHLPGDHVIAMFVAIGKGIEPAFPRSGQLEMHDVVIENRF